MPSLWFKILFYSLSSLAQTEGQIEYNTTSKVFEYYNGSAWASMDMGDTTVACSTAAQIRYDNTNHRLEYCDGNTNTWHTMMGTDSLTACSTTGSLQYDTSSKYFLACSGSTNTWWEIQKSTFGNFFVLGSTNYSGDLQGVQGAHGLCLNELKSANWNGKSTVTLHGGTVWAWLCDSSSCSDLSPSTTYTFARAGSATAGGATFTTNASRQGPGFSTAWSGSTYFGANSYYWTGRSGGSGSLWATTPDSNHCSDWIDDTSASSGRSGYSNNTGTVRWRTTIYLCTNSKALVCFVDDDGDSGDKTPDAVNWTDFTSSSSTVTFTNFTGAIGLKLQVTDLIGSPLLEFNRNGTNWVSFSSASDYQLGVRSGDTLQFRIANSTTPGDKAQISVINESNGNAVLDTVIADKQNFGHYMIISNSNHNGNFSGLSGGDSLCLNDLRSKNWLGKGTAALNSSTVKIWLCDGTSCNDLSASSEYQFAIMGSATGGGARFTTDASGRGPQNSDQWNAATHFGGAYIWTARTSVSATLWSTTSHAHNCNGWTDSTNSYDGRAGYTNNTNASRWNTSSYICSNTRRYVCLVNDDGTNDVTPVAIDWVDFVGSSTSESFTGINVATDIKVSAVNVTGTPTLEYRLNGGSWVGFTTASPATFQVSNNDTLEFRATGSSTHNADLTIINESLGTTVVDTVRATVP